MKKIRWKDSNKKCNGFLHTPPRGEVGILEIPTGANSVASGFFTHYSAKRRQAALCTRCPFSWIFLSFALSLQMINR